MIFWKRFQWVRDAHISAEETLNIRRVLSGYTIYNATRGHKRVYVLSLRETPASGFNFIGHHYPQILEIPLSPIPSAQPTI